MGKGGHLARIPALRARRSLRPWMSSSSSLLTRSASCWSRCSDMVRMRCRNWSTSSELDMMALGKHAGGHVTDKFPTQPCTQGEGCGERLIPGDVTIEAQHGRLFPRALGSAKAWPGEAPRPVDVSKDVKRTIYAAESERGCNRIRAFLLRV